MSLANKFEAEASTVIISGVGTITQPGLAIFTLSGIDENKYVEWSSDLPNGKVGEYRFNPDGEAMLVYPFNPLKYTADIPLDYVDSKASFYVSATGTNRAGVIETTSRTGTLEIVSLPPALPYKMSFSEPAYYVSPTGKGSVDFTITSDYPVLEYDHVITHTTSGNGFPPTRIDAILEKTYTLDFESTEKNVTGYWEHNVCATVVQISTGKVMENRGYTLYEGNPTKGGTALLWDDNAIWDDSAIWSNSQEQEEWFELLKKLRRNKVCKEKQDGKY